MNPLQVKRMQLQFILQDVVDGSVVDLIDAGPGWVPFQIEPVGKIRDPFQAYNVWFYRESSE